MEIVLEIKRDNGDFERKSQIVDVENLENKIFIDDQQPDENNNLDEKQESSKCIAASLKRIHFSSKKKDIKLSPNKSSALLQVYLDYPVEIPENREEIFVKLFIGNQIQESSAINKNSHWKSSFFFFLENPRQETLNIHLIDQSTSEDFAQITYKISSLLSRNNMEQKLRTFTPFNNHECEVLMSMRIYAIQRIN